MLIKKIVNEVINETIRDKNNIQRKLNSEVYKFARSITPEILEACVSIKDTIGLGCVGDEYQDYDLVYNNLDKRLGWFGLQFDTLFIQFVDYDDRGKKAAFGESKESNVAIIELSPTRMLRSINPSITIYRNLIHELTHLLDWCDAQNENYPENNKSILSDLLYWLSKTEMQSRLQETYVVAANLLRNIDYIPNINELIEMTNDASRLDDIKFALSELSSQKISNKDISNASKMLNINFGNISHTMVIKLIKKELTKRLVYFQEKLYRLIETLI